MTRPEACDGVRSADNVQDAGLFEWVYFASLARALTLGTLGTVYSEKVNLNFDTGPDGTTFHVWLPIPNGSEPATTMEDPTP